MSSRGLLWVVMSQAVLQGGWAEAGEVEAGLGGAWLSCRYSWLSPITPPT